MHVQTDQDVLFNRMRQARRIEAECLRVSKLLSFRAYQLAMRRAAINSFSGLVGSLAIIATIFYPGAEVSSKLPGLLAGLSGTVLLLLPIVYSVLIPDPPSRYRDYAIYLASFANRIESLLLKRDRDRLASCLLEVIDLAQTNLADVRVKWPKLIDARDSTSPDTDDFADQIQLRLVI